MKIISKVILIAIVFFSSAICAQDEKFRGFEKKHYIGTQAFMVLTPLLDPSPEYFQLNYGYRYTSRDELSVELITWRTSGPIGRPFGPDFEDEASDFPGDIKSTGIGLAYKRFLWKGLYGQIHSTAFKQTYRNPAEETIQTGFMLFNTLRLGYHFKFFKNRLFVAPSIAVTHWPILTNMPEAFQREEDKWANYFVGEPGLHIGFTF